MRRNIELDVEMAHALQMMWPQLPRQLGVTERAYKRAGGFGVGYIEKDGEIYYPSNEEAGELAILMPVMDVPHSRCTNDILDIVAFQPDQPERWWLRLGAGKCLAPWAERVVRANTPNVDIGTKPPSLRVFRSPRRWLRFECEGVCVLHPRHLNYILGGGIRVVAEDVMHGKTLDRQQQMVERLQIFVSLDE